jgi:hypothetical protein
MPMWLILPVTNSSPRLTAEEIEAAFELSYQVHDHAGSTPGRPIFWLRQETPAAERFWN